MPSYNYKCSLCKDITLVMQKISDPPLTSCEKCEGELKRMITGGTGLIFKGNGFYLTDYVRKNQNKENKEKTVNTDNKVTK